MLEHVSETNRLRDKARATRALAEAMTDPECRQIMMDLAKDYERLAPIAEQQEARD
jgi:hypothetical protein